MAYDLGTRFVPTPKYYTLLDPGAYQSDNSSRKQNAAPFLSRTPRDTNVGAKLWTQAVYKQHETRKIPNCTSFMSKQPRFPYEAFSAEDLEEILCKCGIQRSCECLTGKEKDEDVICQGKVRRRIYKGPTPRSILGDEGLSAPSRKDFGFIIMTDGSQQRLRKEEKEECPPFYDARVNESTAFYRGCKWSQWTSKRSPRSLGARPGPGHYTTERGPTEEEICAEKVRANKRKTSRQLRFIEMIQQSNILENRPGPAHYTPMLPKGTDLKFTGTKSIRFPTSNYDISPGPQDYWLRRDFDPIYPVDVPCHATLPEPACFGTKAKRFKHQCEEGASPATYNVNYKICNYVHCPTAPFGTSAQRFKKEVLDYKDDEDDKDSIFDDETSSEPCPSPTWEFKSKTIRMKPLVKNYDEPSPADLPQKIIQVKRSSPLQYGAPFFSSEGRFRPWYNWIPVHGTLETPGPGEYCLDKPKCLPAFIHGPLCRARRFPPSRYQTPAPNEYKVNDGIETILATHNHRLKTNIENKYKFLWEEPVHTKSLSYEEQEAALLNRSISLLDVDETPNEVKPEIRKKVSKPVITDERKNPKMLRTFLYATPLQAYI